MKTLVVYLHNLTKYVTAFQKWMERFRGVATKYLDAYLGWFNNLEEFNFDLSQKPSCYESKRTHPTYTNQ